MLSYHKKAIIASYNYINGKGINSKRKNDPLESQQRIMIMTSRERKQLRTNKSNLRDQKKKLAKGSKIKV